MRPFPSTPRGGTAERRFHTLLAAVIALLQRDRRIPYRTLTYLLGLDEAVLAARIDRLPPEEKRLLQTAAVIGTEVPWPLLQAIADEPDEALHRGLAHVQAAEFLYETSLLPEHAYTFKHALTHEVAYGSLLHERRRALHARIVEALEALAGDRRDNQVERLAQHALRGEVWDKALSYGRQAGDKAQPARPTARRWCATSRRWWPWCLSPLVVRPPSRPLTSRSAYAMRWWPWQKRLGVYSTTDVAPKPSPRRWATPCGSGGSTPR